MRSPLSALNVSRDQVALRALEQAVARLRRLESELAQTFEELSRAIEGCHDQGIEMVVRFDKPTDAAWASWRNQSYVEQ